MFLENKYSRAYYSILNNAIDAKRSRKQGYFENHHIIPKCSPFNGVDSKENRVLLTPKEHFICHLLLVKMTEGEGKYKMACAINNMTRMSIGQDRKITAAQFDMGKRLFSQYKTGTKLTEEQKKKFQGRTSWNKGLTKATDERIAKMSLEMSGDNHHRPMLNREVSEETRQKMSQSQQGHNNSFYGKTHSNETKEKWSKTRKGIKHTDAAKMKISSARLGNKATAGAKWINNGIIAKLLLPGEILPPTFVFGRKLRC